MVPSLTAGSINRILDFKDVSGAVIQILACKKIPGTGNDRYRLLISDGVTGCPFAMLGTQLNSLVTNKELEKFTIIRVDKCVCNEIQPDKKVIILLNLAVLVPGSEVNEKIGNPTTARAIAPSGVAESNQVNSNNNESSSVFAGVGIPSRMNGSFQSVRPNASFTPYQNNRTIKIMVPSLTNGSINRILSGENVSGAVVQILGCKKIPGIGNDRYRLLISDGVTGCPFAMLGTQFNSLVTNKELEKFTIIHVDKCVCNQVQPDKKVILLKLAVLVPGSEVNEKIGNPTMATAATPDGAAENNQVNGNNGESRTVFAVASNVSIPPQMNGSVQSVHPIASLTPYQNKWTLTAGSINRMLDFKDVSGAVVQILGCKKIPGTGNDRYRLMISDGVTATPFVMLGTQLNSLVTNKELEKFTIIRVDKCVCDQVQPDKKVIILLNLAVLVPGSEVNKKIGNPTTAITGGAAKNNQVNCNNNESRSVFAVESNVGIPPQMNGSVQSVHPIASLSPYKNKWTIKARVTNKTPIRTWSNYLGKGRLFCVILLDESGEIRATGFNEFIDKFYEILEINKVFYISRASLKLANRNYSTVNNDYEMTFNAETTITPYEESSASIPMFDFVPNTGERCLC